MAFLSGLTSLATSKTGWSESRFLSFVGHLTSYLPTLIIVGFGVMVGISELKLLKFWIFASTTISLEVCIGCLRSKYATVQRYSRLAVNAKTEQERSRIAMLLREAERLRKWCWLFVGIVFSSWMMVGFCEVWHISETGITTPEVDGDGAVMGKSEIKLPQLPRWNQSAIAFLSGLNLIVAFMKMWQLAGDNVQNEEEFYSGHLAQVQSLQTDNEKLERTDAQMESVVAAAP